MSIIQDYVILADGFLYEICEHRVRDLANEFTATITKSAAADFVIVGADLSVVKTIIGIAMIARNDFNFYRLHGMMLARYFQ